MKVMLFILSVLLPIVWCQQNPEIVGDIISEVKPQGGQAKLNCTVVNKQDGHTVAWSYLDVGSAGEVITNDEKILLFNPECKDGLKKYEIVISKFNNRTTYMLVINCLEKVDYGDYECYIMIRGVDSASWPSKIGHLKETMECQGANCPSSEAQRASAVSEFVLATVTMVTLAKLLL